MKLFYLLIIAIVFNSSLLGCGCVDSSTASAGANQINGDYDSDDDKLSATLQTQIDLLIENLNREVNNNLTTKDSFSLSFEANLELKELDYEISKILEIKKQRKKRSYE